MTWVFVQDVLGRPNVRGLMRAFLSKRERPRNIWVREGVVMTEEELSGRSGGFKRNVISREKVCKARRWILPCIVWKECSPGDTLILDQ